MAVVGVSLKWSGETAQWAREFNGQGGSYQFTAVFDVVVDDPAAHDSINILLDPDERIPKEGDAWAGNFYLRARNASATRLSPIHFQITVHYKTRSLSSDQNPLNEPPKIRWVTVKTEGEIDEDVSGNPIATVNHEPIKGMRRPFSDLALHISQNFASFDQLAFRGFIDRVSTTMFAGFPGGTTCVDNLEAELIIEGEDEDTFSYWNVAAVIISRKPIRTTDAKAWYLRVRHEGFIVKNDSDELEKATVNGELASQPVLLDVDGKEVTDPNDAHWLEFEVLEGADLNEMGFDI